MVQRLWKKDWQLILKLNWLDRHPHIPHLGSCDDWGDLYLDQDAKTSYPDLPNTGFGISELFNAHCIASTQNTEE